MIFEQLGIDGVWLLNSEQHYDYRGSFQEWFSFENIKENLGMDFTVAQANLSYSNKNALRGIHFSVANTGQAKLVTCVSGAILDVIVDLRPNSETFGKWISFELHSKTGTSILIGEKLGHGFLALEDNTAVSYLITSKYSPDLEYSINPLDPVLAISWPSINQIISEKDKFAPSLTELIQKKVLI